MGKRDGRGRSAASCWKRRSSGYVDFMPIFRVSFFAVAWVVIGIVVAVVEDYFDSLGTAGRVLTAIAAVLIWPLLLLGFDIRIRR